MELLHHLTWVPAQVDPDKAVVMEVEVGIVRDQPAGVPAHDAPPSRDEEAVGRGAHFPLDGVYDDIHPTPTDELADGGNVVALEVVHHLCS
jgi:hypothetical protein